MAAVAELPVLPGMDVTAVLIAAVATYGGKEPIYLGPGDWYTTGLVIDVDNTELTMHPEAKLHMVPTAGNYSVVAVTAARVRIRSGQIIGDWAAHLGTAGEHGHGIIVDQGADNCLISDVTISECWGDGIYCTGNTERVTLERVVAHSNRRNNLSIVGGNRVRVIDSDFYAAGTLGALVGTAPMAGVDVEPNPDGYDVTDFRLADVRVRDNRGPGLCLVRANNTQTTGVVRDLLSTGNLQQGIQVAGSGATGAKMDVTIKDSQVQGNTLQGINIACPGFRARDVEVLDSGDIGVYVTQPTELTDLTVRLNGRSGVRIDTSGAGTQVSDSVVDHNGVATHDTYQEVQIGAPGVRLRSVCAFPSATAPRTRYAFYVTAGTTGAKLANCDGSAGSQGTVVVQPDTVNQNFGS